MKKKTRSRSASKGLQVVCEELMGLTLKKRPLIVLRKVARACVNQIGDPKKDYHFVVYKFGKKTDIEFVVTSSEGLRHFGRTKLRNVS